MWCLVWKKKKEEKKESSFFKFEIIMERLYGVVKVIRTTGAKWSKSAGESDDANDIGIDGLGPMGDGRDVIAWWYWCG